MNFDAELTVSTQVQLWYAVLRHKDGEKTAMGPYPDMGTAYQSALIADKVLDLSGFHLALWDELT